MADAQHGTLTPATGPGATRGNHTVEGFPSVLDEAARAAVAQVGSDRGRAIYQTAGLGPGWYLADGAGGWAFIGGVGFLAPPHAATHQVGGADAISFGQSLFADVTVDTTTAATTFPGSTLLSQSITLSAGGILLVAFSVVASNSNNNRKVNFRLVVDGVVRRGLGVELNQGAGLPGNGSIVSRIAGLAAGVRLVDIQWHTSANVARVRPVTVPEDEHASMIVQEVFN